MKIEKWKSPLDDLGAVIFILMLALSSCATGKLIVNSAGESVQQPPLEAPAYTLYALGDAGEVNHQSKTVLKQLRGVIGDEQQPEMVIFLGDNVYPAGIPSEADTQEYHRAENILMNQVEALSTYQGKIIFIPGNHDWNEFKAGGLNAIRREGDLITKLNNKQIRFMPKNGCGGPVAVELSDKLVLLIIDSQWWLQDWTKEPQMNEGCASASKEEFINAFREEVALYKNRQIIVAMHHPLYSQGNHGGHFTLKNHIFPLTSLVKWLYIPLPVIGSIYPYYRSVFGHPQDLKNKRYQSLKEALLNNINYDGEMIFLAGHEHCLQYIKEKGDHFLISGAGSKQTPVADSKDLVYGHKAPGFMKLDFYKNDLVWLSVFEVDPKLKSSKVVFSQPIIQRQQSGK